MIPAGCVEEVGALVERAQGIRSWRRHLGAAAARHTRRHHLYRHRCHDLLASLAAPAGQGMKLLLYDTEMRTANGYLPRAISQARPRACWGPATCSSAITPRWWRKPRPVPGMGCWPSAGRGPIGT